MSIFVPDADGDASPFDLDRDPTLAGEAAGSLANTFRLAPAEIERLFFQRYGIGYLVHAAKKSGLRVVTHPRKTNTCFEKAELLGEWDPLDVIKCLYFERQDSGTLVAVVVPETGCFVDRTRVAAALGLDDASVIRKASRFPRNMEPGTCSPFIVAEDLVKNGGPVERIFFDTETLVQKKQEQTLDDLSFGLDHRMSLQMNYYACFKLLKGLYPEAIRDEEILGLAFKELLVRSKGRLKITYEFNSLNYRIARFINGIHGSGDVSIVNDHVDELDLPDVLTTKPVEVEG